MQGIPNKTKMNNILTLYHHILNTFMSFFQVNYTHILRFEDLSNDWSRFIKENEINLPDHLPWENHAKQDYHNSYIEQLPR